MLEEIAGVQTMTGAGAGKEQDMTREELTRIRGQYGDEYIYRQLAEECMELGHAALKLIRAQRSETPVPPQEARMAFIDEAADVRVMLQVVSDMLDADERAWLMVKAAAKNQRMVARLLGA